MKGDRERCLQAGMDDYVAKPVRKNELYTALARFFSVTHGADAEGAASSSMLIDWQRALEGMAGDPDMLRDVAQAASQELPELLQRLEQSVAQPDLSTVHRIAHTIKSSSRILAASEVQADAAKAEQAALDQDVKTMAAASARLRQFIPLMVREIDSFLEQANEPR
jgi:HPt (histidine-containing phosphotransfer) domain-containing protein